MTWSRTRDEDRRKKRETPRNGEGKVKEKGRRDGGRRGGTKLNPHLEAAVEAQKPLYHMKGDEGRSFNGIRRNVIQRGLHPHPLIVICQARGRAHRRLPVALAGLCSPRPGAQAGLLLGSGAAAPSSSAAGCALVTGLIRCLLLDLEDVWDPWADSTTLRVYIDDVVI